MRNAAGKFYLPAAYIYKRIMEINFSELKQKDVINISDGRHMGRVCDLLFSFPQNNVLGFTVTGSKGFKFSKQEIFLPIETIVKIGEDAVLVKFGKEEAPKPPKGDNCPPQYYPPNNCPPNNCPPCPPNNCPPQYCPPNNRPQNNRPPQGYPPQSRRSLDEYE